MLDIFKKKPDWIATLAVVANNEITMFFQCADSTIESLRESFVSRLKNDKHHNKWIVAVKNREIVEGITRINDDQGAALMLLVSRQSVAVQERGRLQLFVHDEIGVAVAEVDERWTAPEGEARVAGQAHCDDCALTWNYNAPVGIASGIGQIFCPRCESHKTRILGSIGVAA